MLSYLSVLINLVLILFHGMVLLCFCCLTLICCKFYVLVICELLTKFDIQCHY
jgi:hypothetical protein